MARLQFGFFITCFALLISHVHSSQEVSVPSRVINNNVARAATFTLPPIATSTSASCHVEGRVNATLPLWWTISSGYFGPTNVMECQWYCDRLRENCNFFSFNSNTKECVLWDNNQNDGSWDLNTGMPLEHLSTGIFFYSKLAACVNYVNLNSTSSHKFPAGGDNIWINDDLDDCGIEGRPSNASQSSDINGHPLASWPLETILECQEDCSIVTDCRSYSFNTTAAKLGLTSCFEYSTFLVETRLGETIIPGDSGLYFSDSSAKMGNDCFRNKTFGITMNKRQDTPTTTVAGMPEVTSVTNSDCNIEGTPSGSVYNGSTTYAHPLECNYACMAATFCQAYSWTPAASKNCALYGGSISGLSIKPGKSGVFYSGKRSGCFGIAPIKTPSSAPFAGEEGIEVNTAVNDCGIEGSSANLQPGLTTSYKYKSIMECQSLCNSQDGCISYSWNTTSTGNNCAFFYTWLAGNIVEGSTGVYWSEGKGKTGYDCFSKES